MSDPRPVLGIDPGGAHTGLCVRLGATGVEAHVVDRQQDETYWPRGVGVGPPYIEHVCHIIARLVSKWDLEDMAVEAVVAPNPHHRGQVRVTNPIGAIGAAMVLGAVLGRWPSTIVVPPQQHGQKILRAYPPLLIDPRERRLGLDHVGTGRLRHARAAFDVAGQAPLWRAHRFQMQRRLGDALGETLAAGR